MSFESVLLIMSIHALALISPGPDFAIVTRLAISSGRRSGLWGAAGVATAIGVYVLITVLGLSLVLAALPGLSRLLSVAGALYLAWLGVQCLRSTGQLPDAQSQQPVGQGLRYRLPDQSAQSESDALLRFDSFSGAHPALEHDGRGDAVAPAGRRIAAVVRLCRADVLVAPRARLAAPSHAMVRPLVGTALLGLALKVATSAAR